MNIQIRNTGTKPPILWRYTNLAAVIHHLQTKTITLLDPVTWNDRNDTFFLQKYKSEQNVKTLLALCFSQQFETYHHWRVFASGVDGVCIQFDKERLVNSLDESDGFEHGIINYKGINQLNKVPPKLEELPFLKRLPYRDEQEYRVIYVNKRKTLESLPIDIKISWIKRIRLSPWIPKALVRSTKDILKSIDGCSNLQIVRSTLIENERWKDAANRIHV